MGGVGTEAAGQVRSAEERGTEEWDGAVRAFSAVVPGGPASRRLWPALVCACIRLYSESALVRSCFEIRLDPFSPED